MPEFVLDTGSREIALEYRKLDAFTRGYIEAAFFTDEEQLKEEMGDKGDVSLNALDRATFKRMIEDCHKFQEETRELIEQACEINEDYDDTRAGHDFWYTRNGHGAGYWDRELGAVGDKLTEFCVEYRGFDLYVGDDGMIYGS